METELTLEQKEIFDREVVPMVQKANGLLIRTADDSLSAQETIKEIKRRRSMLHEKLDPAVKAAYAAHQAAKKVWAFFVNPFDEAETIIKKKVVTYESEQERKRAEEARLAEAKRLEEERKRREELERQAARAEEKGKTEKAEALREKAEAVVAPPVFTPPPPPPVKGSQFRKVWKAECLDLLKLCKSVVEGKLPVGSVSVNQSVLNSFAKAVKDTMKVDGVRFYEETEMAVRT